MLLSYCVSDVGYVAQVSKGLDVYWRLQKYVLKILFQYISHISSQVFLKCFENAIEFPSVKQCYYVVFINSVDPIFCYRRRYYIWQF